MKIALAMIVKGDDKEAECLKNCLGSVAPFVDGVFLTVTQPNKKVEEVAKLFAAETFAFEWCNDFAKARNFSFQQVPEDYDYILWLDADDIVRGIENLKPTLEDNPADAYVLNYLYAFDEHNNPVVVHMKTQIVKNDGCVKWVGKLHEDFTPTRELKAHFIDGIERIHCSNDDRFEANKQRNLEVALEQLKAEPNDPRSQWNAGNAYKAIGNEKEALHYFQIFLNLSESDEEKYIVRLRSAECHFNMGELAKSLDEARYAIGLRPEYPDAYNTLANIYYEMGQLEKARDYYKMGLTKNPPYHSIIVYNPRDYDYVPLRNLAKVYFGLSQPSLALECLKACLKITPDDKELQNLIEKMQVEAERFDKVVEHFKDLSAMTDKTKMVEEIRKLPVEIASHPYICKLRNTHDIKTESSGKDLVIVCNFTERVWDADALKEGIGGSEYAVIALSKLFTAEGWNVTVYNNCGAKEKVMEGVTYRPYWMWNYRDKQDVTILWRSPVMCDYPINSEKVYVDLHDCINPGEFTEKRLEGITKIFVKSQFHRSLFEHISDDKFIVIPNGIRSEEFVGELVKDPYLLVNTSSPDRSLSAFIKGFKKVKEQVPEAKARWAYGWGVFDVVHGDNAKKMEWKKSIIEGMKEAGIEDLGRVNEETVNNLYKEAKVFAYPTEFAEIDCISLTKAMAAGAVPVTTDFAALGEKAKFGEFIHSDKTKDTWCEPYQYDFSLEDEAKLDEWVNKVVEVLNKKVYNTDKMRRWAQDTYNWNTISKVWLEEFNT